MGGVTGDVGAGTNHAVLVLALGSVLAWALLIGLEQIRRHHIAAIAVYQSRKRAQGRRGKRRVHACSFRQLVDWVYITAVLMLIVQVFMFGLEGHMNLDPVMIVSFRLPAAMLQLCCTAVCLRWRRLVKLLRDMKRIKSRLAIGKYKWELAVCLAFQVGLMAVLASRSLTAQPEAARIVCEVLAVVYGGGNVVVALWFAQKLSAVLFETTRIPLPALVRALTCQCRCHAEPPSFRSQSSAELSGKMSVSAGEQQRGIFTELVSTMGRALLLWTLAGLLWVAGIALDALQYRAVLRVPHYAVGACAVAGNTCLIAGLSQSLWSQGPLADLGDGCIASVADVLCGPCLSAVQACASSDACQACLARVLQAEDIAHDAPEHEALPSATPTPRGSLQPADPPCDGGGEGEEEDPGGPPPGLPAGEPTLEPARKPTRSFASVARLVMAGNHWTSVQRLSFNDIEDGSELLAGAAGSDVSAAPGRQPQWHNALRAIQLMQRGGAGGPGAAKPPSPPTPRRHSLVVRAAATAAAGAAHKPPSRDTATWPAAHRASRVARASLASVESLNVTSPMWSRVPSVGRAPSSRHHSIAVSPRGSRPPTGAPPTRSFSIALHAEGRGAWIARRDVNGLLDELNALS